MTTWIALLRGVNVGGHNKLKMAELREAWAAEGAADVRTYIQSGNVLFRSEAGEDELRERMERLLAGRFGIESPVILRTADQLADIAARRPFSEQQLADAQQANGEGESFYVALLQHAPEPAAAAQLEPYRTANEHYVLDGREVYLLLLASVRNSKLAANLGKLETAVTVRNWKTMTKLLELAFVG